MKMFYKMDFNWKKCEFYASEGLIDDTLNFLNGKGAQVKIITNYLLEQIKIKNKKLTMKERRDLTLKNVEVIKYLGIRMTIYGGRLAVNE
jgi:hypothetical protein